MNEQNEIEKLRQERDAAIEAAENLAKLIRAVGPFRRDTGEAIAAIEALQPKPKPLGLWVNYCGDISYGYSSEEMARNAVPNQQRIRTAVHVREVTPAPKWERWEAASHRIIVDGICEAITDRPAEANAIADAHNAEMARLAALWEGGVE